MRNQRVISQTSINAAKNTVLLDAWNNKSIKGGESRGSTLIYNTEDKESNNRQHNGQEGSMPSIERKSPTPHLTKSTLNCNNITNRNRLTKDSKTMNLETIIGKDKVNSRNRHDDDNMVRLPQMTYTSSEVRSGVVAETTKNNIVEYGDFVDYTPAATS